MIRADAQKRRELICPQFQVLKELLFPIAARLEQACWVPILVCMSVLAVPWRTMVHWTHPRLAWRLQLCRGSLAQTHSWTIQVQTMLWKAVCAFYWATSTSKCGLIYVRLPGWVHTCRKGVCENMVPAALQRLPSAQLGMHLNTQNKTVCPLLLPRASCIKKVGKKTLKINK